MNHSSLLYNLVFDEEEVFHLKKNIKSKVLVSNNDENEEFASSSSEVDIYVATFVSIHKMNEEEQQLLSNIIKSTGLKENQYLKINGSEKELNEIVSSLNTELLVVFGSQNEKNNYSISTIDSTSIIYSDTLSELQKDSNKKLQLWRSLKSHLKI